MRKATAMLAPAVLAILSAAAVGGEQPAAKAENLLARLPSAPGEHVERIKALGDNSWLELGAPEPDPKWGPARGGNGQKAGRRPGHSLWQ